MYDVKIKMPRIEIPIDIMHQKEMEATCQHFNCKLLHKKRGDAYYKIESEDATNFFWMGANINNGTLNLLHNMIS